MTFLLTGLDIEAKADLVRRQLAPALAGLDSVTWSLARTDRDDPETNEAAVASLRVTVKDPDGKRIGRPFSSAAVELALASYPGATLTSPPGEASMYGVYWPAAVGNDVVEHVVVLEDGRRVPVEPPATTAPASRLRPPLTGPPAPGAPPAGGTLRAPLGTLVGARSGDKGGNANVGVWARTEDAYRWLSRGLTVERFQELLPETKELRVERHDLPNLLALNFVVHGLLGEGVAAGTRQDPQAKGLGEWLRARHVQIPLALLEEEGV